MYRCNNRKDMLKPRSRPNALRIPLRDPAIAITTVANYFTYYMQLLCMQAYYGGATTALQTCYILNYDQSNSNTSEPATTNTTITNYSHISSDHSALYMHIAGTITLLQTC